MRSVGSSGLKSWSVCGSELGCMWWDYIDEAEEEGGPSCKMLLISFLTPGSMFSMTLMIARRFAFVSEALAGRFVKVFSWLLPR